MGNAQDIIFHTVYRILNVSKPKFFEDFSSSVVGAVSSFDNIILGDLNFHLDKQDSWSKKFNGSLCQHK